MSEHSTEIEKEYVEINPAQLLEIVQKVMQIKQDFINKNGTNKITPEQEVILRKMLDEAFSGERVKMKLPPMPSSHLSSEYISEITCKKDAKSK